MIRTQKGFSLLELILVLGVASAVSLMKFQDLKQQQEAVQANAVGQQMKQVGEAVNGYISIRFDKLSTLTSVTASTGTDPGPRSCSVADNTCTITYQTLVNEGLLPASFSGINANHSGYAIVLRRGGTSPNYVINGLITTTAQWKEGNKIRYDLLGKAMQTAGVDSGVSKTTSTVSGYSGQWAEQAADCKNITDPGLLAYRVGYDSALYSVYLRRDGTLPMTGDLNMGGNSINNVKDITASGTVAAGTLKSTGNTVVGGGLTVASVSTLTGAVQVNNTLTSTGNITSGNWLWAKNGYGDVIGLGGDAASGDYEIKLMQDKPLSVYMNSNRTDLTTVSITGGLAASGNITASNQVRGNTLVSTGRTTTGEFLQINGTVTIGTACSPVGLQERAVSGMPAYCVDGQWQSVGTMIRIAHAYKEKADSLAVYCNSNEVAIGGGGTSFSGVGFTDREGGVAAPGLDQPIPTDSLNGWKVSGMHPQTSNPENLNAYVVCMRRW